MDERGVTYLVVALVALVVTAFPGPGRRRLDRVRGRHGLASGEDAAGLLRAHLRRTRRARGAGLLLAAVTACCLSFAWFVVDVLGHTTAGPFAPSGVALLLFGSMTASALGEVTWTTEPQGHERAASLRVRRLSTYLPGWVPALQRALAGTALAALALLVLLVEAFPVSWWHTVRSPSWGVVLAVGVVGAAAAAELGQRRVLARPQSWTDVDTVRVDDVARARSQRDLAAGAVGVQLLLLSQMALQVVLRVADVTGHPGVADRAVTAPTLAHVLPPVALVALVWWRLARLPLTPDPGAGPGPGARPHGLGSASSRTGGRAR